MFKRIKEWVLLAKEKWWGGLVVYASIFGLSYATLWAISEPLDLISLIPITGINLGRRVFYILLVLLMASHTTVIVYLIGAIRQHTIYPNRNTDGKTRNTPATDRGFPTRDQLISDRTSMRDKRISRHYHGSWYT
jgi:hypothetical protein